jgi:hypothetical protein
MLATANMPLNALYVNELASYDPYPSGSSGCAAPAADPSALISLP